MNKKKDEKLKAESCCQEGSKDCCRGGARSYATPSSGVYGLGVIGSFIFFFQHAAVANDYLMGAFKSIFWPAYIVYYFWQQTGW